MEPEKSGSKTLQVQCLTERKLALAVDKDHRRRLFQKSMLPPHRQSKTHLQSMLWCEV